MKLPQSLFEALPFFYLRGDGFFHHRPFNDEEQSYKALSDPGSIKKFTGIVEYAYLDEELWAYLQDQNALNIIRDGLIQSYGFGTIRLRPFLHRCIVRPIFFLTEHIDSRWMNASDWDGYTWAPDDAPIVEQVLKEGSII